MVGGGAGSLAGSKDGADDHLSGVDKTDDPTGISGRTSMKSTERLVIALLAFTGQADSSATVSLAVTRQTDCSQTGACS